MISTDESFSFADKAKHYRGDSRMNVSFILIFDRKMFRIYTIKTESSDNLIRNKNYTNQMQLRLNIKTVGWLGVFLTLNILPPF